MGNDTAETRLITLRVPHALLRRLDAAAANGKRSAYVVRAIERALADEDQDDPYTAGLADGFERALQMLERQTWLAKRTAELVKKGTDSVEAMAQANDEWKQKCEDDRAIFQAARQGE